MPPKTTIQDELDGQMSFLSHLEEFRIRLIKSFMFVGVAFVFCYAFSGSIFRFLEIPVNKALADVQSRAIPVKGLTGNEKILNLNTLSEGKKIRYVFNQTTSLGSSTIVSGTSVLSVVAKDSEGNVGLFTDESLSIGNLVIPEGIRLPVNFFEPKENDINGSGKMVFTTAMEPFQLYITVSLYSAVALSIPFLLLQIWGFISPALYKHERSYVTPFIFLSSISFILGAAFAYYILFPPAMTYLLGVGSDFTPLLRVTDYFEFITLIMLAMGIVFQMPAIAYVLSRIGIITAAFLLRSWKIALVVILIVAAVVSPTGDAFNMMLFATPMMALYLVSIFVAWFFGKKRESDTNELIN